MNASTILRVARDEWQAVEWDERGAAPGPTGGLLGYLPEHHDGGPVRVVRIMAWPVAGGWNASIVWGTGVNLYWRPRGTHRTLRAALRDLRAHLAWDLAGAIQAATLMPESADWTAVERLAAVARRWA
jgi:hypothetical protein